MEAAITQLEISLATMENNAPINEAEGKTEQAALERANAESYRKAIALLKAPSAKLTEPAPPTGQ